MQEKILLGTPCLQHVILDEQCVAFFCREHLLQPLVIRQAALQGLVVLPDHREKQQAHEAETDSDLLADSELHIKSFHRLRLHCVKMT